MVELRELYGMKVFDCQQLHASLTPQACAENFRSGSGRRALCSQCPVGAAHAGQKLIAGISSKLCCRCGRTDQRLIRKQVCVSCFNREAEYLRGRNAKGVFPVHARPVRPADVFVAGHGPIHLDRVAEPAEAVLMALRRHPGAMVRPLPPG